MDKDEPKLLPVSFSPENWGTLERFTRFYQGTHNLDHQARKRIAGIEGHFRKAQRILALLTELAPRISEDERHLAEHGFSPALRAYELAALVEKTFLELYATLDCYRHVFRAIFSRHRGIKDSTRKLFQAAFDNRLPATLPTEVVDPLKATQPWFPELLRLRDELIHATTGFLTRDKDTGSLTYLHPGLQEGNCCLVIEDVVSKIKQFSDDINHFLGTSFAYLCSTLKDAPTRQVCGVFNARIYERIVRPSEAIDFHGGICKSLEWFERDDNPPCPLREMCGAYKRAKNEASPAGPTDEAQPHL